MTATVVFGGRDFKNVKFMWRVLDVFHSIRSISVLICGMQRGADLSGWKWADARGVRKAEYYPDWTRYKKAAGRKRNLRMGDHPPEYGIAFDGNVGTAHMMSILEQRNIPRLDMRGLDMQYCAEDLTAEFERKMVQDLLVQQQSDPNYDIIDVLTDYMKENEKIDPYDFKFTPEFKEYVREAAVKRKMIRHELDRSRLAVFELDI